MLEGLEYYHSQGAVHRDIKASNLLMDSDGSVVISDFGVSGWVKTAGSPSHKLDTFTGTPCWMAPEVISSSDPYDSKADIWSLGITALELAKGYAPYAMYEPAQVMKLTVMESPPTLKTYDVLTSTPHDAKFSKQFNEIVALCLQKDPKHRPSAAALLKKSYFKRARCRTTLVTELLDKMPVKDAHLPDNGWRSDLSCVSSALRNGTEGASRHKHVNANHDGGAKKGAKQAAHVHLSKRESSLWDFGLDELSLAEQTGIAAASGTSLSSASTSAKAEESIKVVTATGSTQA